MSTVKRSEVRQRPVRILLLYHCKANSGYAIDTLERTFWRMAQALAGRDDENIFLSYSSYDEGYPTYVPRQFNNYYQFKPGERNPECLRALGSFLKNKQIDVIFGFDQPPNLRYYKTARAAGVKSIISYWGAPMGSLNSGLRLILKRLEVMLYRYDPDLYIFESRAMQRSGYQGRGIPRSKTAVCPLGVDIDKFRPDPEDHYYAHDLFGIARDQKIVFYSGHFEERKGVAVIAQAANLLSARKDISFVLFGNRPGEEVPYQKLLSSEARERVIFGGYRPDLNRIHRSCYVGVIASTGWDSFTVSSIEMQASGLPLFVSNLPGLNETVKHGESGAVFEPGNYHDLAKLISEVADSREQWSRMARCARDRAESLFSSEKQIDTLRDTVQASLDL